MSTDPTKPRATKSPAKKTPAAATPAAKPAAAGTPATSTPAAQPQSSGPQTLLMVGVVIVLAALAFIVFLIATGRGTVLTPAPANNVAEVAPLPIAPPPPPAPAGPPQPMPNRGQLLPSGLRIETIREGRGRLITRADTPLIRYELRVLGHNEVIDGDFAAPQPTPMPLDGLIPGFVEALTHMRPGGEARFWVPPNLGYGSEPRPGAPFGPTDILEFHVKVEGLAPAGRPGAAPAGNEAAEVPIPAPGQ